jgi:hypothetical protein
MAAVEKDVRVAMTFDFDACCGWIGTLGATTPGPISRGQFGPIGLWRVLALLDKYGIKGMFCIPADHWQVQGYVYVDNLENNAVRVGVENLIGAYDSWYAAPRTFGVTANTNTESLTRMNYVMSRRLRIFRKLQCDRVNMSVRLKIVRRIA